MKKDKGITLIALVVTIIVLLILAGVSINMLIGQNGILNRATEAKEKTEEAKLKEQSMLDNYEEQITNYAGINWDLAKANAKAPEEQKEERNNGVIGIGTDGKAVNMDLWKYGKMQDGTYGLNSQSIIDKILQNDWSNVTCGYKGKIVDGKIEETIPQYIKCENDNEFIEVTELPLTFYKLNELKEISDFPVTLVSMNNTFLHCDNLENVGNIPNSVSTMNSTFSNCTNLKETPVLPSSLTDMSQAFFNCSNLIKTVDIPNNVVYMVQTFMGCEKMENTPNIPYNVKSLSLTFYGCKALKDVPCEIPKSVTNMNGTFTECSNLSGTITINASINGSMISENKNDYYGIFFNAATNDGCEIKLTGSCSVLKDIISMTNRNNITLL